MASDLKPVSRTELKTDFQQASRIFRRDCEEYFASPSEISLGAVNASYGELEAKYHVVCPHRDPLSAFIHRIRQAVIRALERFCSFCNGDEEAFADPPPMSSREIKREFESCRAVLDFLNRTQAPFSLPPEYLFRFTPPIQSRSLATNATKPKTTTHPPAAPRAAAAPQNQLTPSLASQGIKAVGLKNPRSNCWVITFFQIIAHTSPLREMYLNVAKALQKGPNPNIEGNVENFNELADQYVAFSKERKGSLEAKLARQAAEKKELSEWNEQILKMIEDTLPATYFVIPKTWNPAPSPPSAPSSSAEETPPAATPMPPLSEKEIQTQKKQARRFKRILREKIEEEQKSLPKKCQDACKGLKGNGAAQAILNTCGASLKRAWDATCADKNTPHLSQELIDDHVKPSALRYSPKISGSQETKTKHVYAETLTEILDTLYPEGSALTPAEQQIYSLLAGTREEAIEIAQGHGYALAYALAVYDVAVDAHEHSLPEDISQSLRLALHFMAPPILDQVLNRSISQLPGSQEDASEVLGILLPIHSKLLGQDYGPLTFKVTPSKTWEQRSELPLTDEIQENPVPPQKPEIKPLGQPENVGSPLDPPKKELTIEEIKTPEQVDEAKEGVKAENAAQLQHIAEELRKVDQKRAELLKLQAGLKQYHIQISNHLDVCGKLNRQREETAKIKAQIAQAEEALSKPDSSLEGLPFDVVDGTSITRSKEAQPQHSLLVNFPADLPKGEKPKLISLLEGTLCQQVQNGTMARFIHNGQVRMYQNVSEQSQFDRFPPCLILHMNRFSDSVDPRTGVNTAKKNTTVLEVPLTLQLPEEAVKSPPLEEGTPPAESPDYALESFVVHSGGTSPHGGHYIAYWKDSESGKWIRGSDGSTTIVSEKDALGSAGEAYMLFYRNTAISPENAPPETHDDSKE